MAMSVPQNLDVSASFPMDPSTIWLAVAWLRESTGVIAEASLHRAIAYGPVLG